jgi:AcrR family transcriptional regulator
MAEIMNRDKILEQSLRLFSQRGFDAVGVQEIVEAVGVTKPTLYHYFGSKQGLLDAVLQEQFGILEETCVPASAYRHDVKNTLVAIAQSFFHFAKTHPAFYRLALALWFAPEGGDGFRAVDKYNARMQARLEDVFESAAKDHGNMKGRHKAYAATFLGMMNTYIGLALNGHLELNDELAFKAVHQFMHGIFS